jgi:DNA-binding IclR family transcriptional regulator
MIKVLQCLADSDVNLTASQISGRTGLSITEVEEAVVEAYKLGYVE